MESMVKRNNKIKYTTKKYIKIDLPKKKKKSKKWYLDNMNPGEVGSQLL